MEATGRWQVCLLALVGFNYAIVAINHALPTFHGYTPPFHCDLQDGDYSSDSSRSSSGSSSSNGTLEGCLPPGEVCEGGYTFTSDRNDSTVVTEWQLVCDRRLLHSLVPTLYFSGVTLGALAGGLATDRYGRRPALLVALYAQGALGLALYAVASLQAFIAVRFAQGFFVQVVQGATCTLLMELFPARARTAVGVALEAYWALGLSVLAGVAFALPGWREMQLALAAPTLATLLYVCLVPESPRWLSTRGRHAAAASELQRIADRNVRLAGGPGPAPGVETQPITARRAEESGRGEAAAGGGDDSIVVGAKGGYVTEQRTRGVIDLFRSPVLRKYNCIMVFVWFSISLSYYGIMFYLPRLSGERHLNFLMGAALELASYFSAYFVLSRFGRRLPLSFYLILSGVLCAAVGCIGANDGPTAVVQTALALLGKAAVVSAFCTINIYTSELFPTVVRAAAIGFCGFWARVGSLLSPQLLLLGEVTWKPVPLVTMGVLVIAAGLATLLLPETFGCPLADTVEQAEEMQTRRKAAQ